MPTAQSRPSSSRTRSAQAQGDLVGRPEQPDRAGDVHEGLVEADRLDHRRDVVQDLLELPADLGVAAVTSDRKTASGHSWRARTDGIAERTPKARAS